MKTERMTILVTAEEKAVIRRRAQSLGVSTGEMVRRAVTVYNPAIAGARAEDEAVLNALADELFAAAREARAALAAANKGVRSTLKHLSRRREAIHGGV